VLKKFSADDLAHRSPMQLLDTPALEPSIKHNLLVATQRLARTTGFFPHRFSLQNVELLVSRPLAGGGFADIYKGSVGGQHVCLKAARLYETDQMNYLWQVCAGCIREAHASNILSSASLSRSCFMVTIKA
jgi:hypothetical protein